MTDQSWPQIHAVLESWDEEQQKRFPLFWSPQLLSEIEGTTAFDVFSTARRGVEQEYTQVLSELCPELASKFSMDSYKKVWALINSRILTLPESSHPALVPLFDLVNHHLPMPSKPLRSTAQVQRHLNLSLGRYGLKGQHLELWLQKPLKRPGEITDVYGLQSNEETLWSFGFTVPWIHNLTCLTRLRVHLTKWDLPRRSTSEGGSEALLGLQEIPEMHLERLLRFELGGCSSKKWSIRRSLWKPLSFLRVWLVSLRADLLELRRSCSLTLPEALQPFLDELPLTTFFSSTWHLNEQCSHVTREEEQLALQTMFSHLDQALQRMKGVPAASADEQLLAKDLDGALHDAITIRRDEKDLIAKHMAWLKHRMEQLKRKWPAAAHDEF
ncbi:Hypothetical protein (Fragment) [Durusdinium trenchii]|uniref:Rubisco LSMT substrate-binding domain-containing protein n=1 Tax=Durusdinium trenchii TaxID=1381693 RepID=A0ABP0QHB2_9DINO